MEKLDYKITAYGATPAIQGASQIIFEKDNIRHPIF